ncbi:transcriptional regulator with XRE-family HTH domain [Allocatelliglobosispora scoriae]|uniref:Transcriptional regulator with XRE-family HTH domain n=1 Tax=Allocatelliglobosispora scoriae TaxID=643052 RepID=A0A841BQ09_9ACTN|nr:helix-turn-helix transcriptional regulator [Allocatelliglobosispora scoriae]MBB5871157.1 transcriptional regulator with XRE-family HTH domain [Allocatelliglobosispora scoriae]
MTGNASPNGTLYNLRTAAGLSQQDVAERMNDIANRDGRAGQVVTSNAVSRWERGYATPSPLYRRLLAEVFSVTVDELGLHLHREEPKTVRPEPAKYAYAEVEDVDLDPRVVHSQDAWRRTRRAMNAQRPGLTQLAAQVYDSSVRLGRTGLLTAPGWLPDEPVDLADIELTYDAAPPEPAINGTEQESDNVRPRSNLTRHYPRYTQAVRDLDPPRLFESRPCWRMLDLEWTVGKGAMRFGPSTYFAGVDTYEALAHETAFVHLDGDGSIGTKPPVMRDLPFRKLIGSPFDFGRRPLLPSIDTLTIRQGPDGASFILHKRDPRRVAVAGGMLQVIPSGVFQPSSVLPSALNTDFDLWRNTQREYSEELFGNPEHEGSGQPVSYDQEPFLSLDAARAEGRVRALCLGVALDALTLVGEILTVVVFDADVFDDLAHDFVEVNDEGTVINQRVPFTAEGIESIMNSGMIAPAGAGCIELAWQHRESILGM